MTGSDVIVPEDVDVGARMAALVRRPQNARGAGIGLLNLVGGTAETLLERLPGLPKPQLEAAARSALETLVDAAGASRRIVPDQKPWVTTALTTGMGAAGGAGGLPTALAELPVTTTMLFRAILAAAQENGFSPEDPATRLESLRVFAVAGPLEDDDGADLGFLSARVTLTGAAVQGLIARVAPRVAAVLGQKLAAQTVPVLGAAAGAAINYRFSRYYQDMAQVHFGLIRLSQEAGVPRHEMVALFQSELKKPRQR